jgi:hypothetical protein
VAADRLSCRQDAVRNGAGAMRPITISIDDELLATLEQRGERRG